MSTPDEPVTALMAVSIIRGNLLMAAATSWNAVVPIHHAAYPTPPTISRLNSAAIGHRWPPMRRAAQSTTGSSTKLITAANTNGTSA
jgi:hypothetical protein